jgi:hypothetical protein
MTIRECCLKRISEEAMKNYVEERALLFASICGDLVWFRSALGGLLLGAGC